MSDGSSGSQLSQVVLDSTRRKANTFGEHTLSEIRLGLEYGQNPFLASLLDSGAIGRPVRGGVRESQPQTVAASFHSGAGLPASLHISAIRRMPRPHASIIPARKNA